MTTPNWHRFYDTEDGDDQCAGCGVVVTLEAHMTFTTPCPAGDCTSAKNPDRGCVFVPIKDTPCRCIYCGRSGDRDHETEEVPDYVPGTMIPVGPFMEDEAEVAEDLIASGVAAAAS